MSSMPGSAPLSGSLIGSSRCPRVSRRSSRKAAEAAHEDEVEEQDMRVASERGIALILAVLMTLGLTALTAALMMTSKTEAWSGMNYRMLAQSRYGAEAGMHRAANYLLNSYTPPGGAADPLANYNMSVSPVTYNGNPVVLSSMGAVASNYPVAAVVNAFQAASQGSMAADSF